MDFEYQGGVLVPVRPAAPDFREVATTADGRDITRGFVDAMPLLPPLDPVLRARGGDYRVYEELLRDDQVHACFQQLRLGIVSSEWKVEPGGDRRIDKNAAAFLEEQLRHNDFDRLTDRMAYGAFYGYAVAEMLWGRDGNNVVLADARVRKPRRFGFSSEGELRLRTTSNPWGEPVKPRKFWHFAYGGDSSDEPYGLGMAHALYWPVFFKRNGMKFWLIFLEKFGQPTALGKFPINATPAEKQRLLSALSAIQTDAGIIVPDGMAVDLIEAARSGTADYGALMDRMDAGIAKVILSQTATTQGTPGRLGSDDTQSDMFNNQVKAIADLICQSFNRGPARWLTDWNFPGAAPPKVWRQTEPDEDLDSRAKRDKTLYDMGFKPTLQTIQDTYPGEWEQRAPTPTPPLAQGGPADPAFAETGDALPADTLADRLAIEAGPAQAQWLRQIRAMVNQADSLPALRNQLLAAFGELPPDELSETMAAAFAVAELVGRFDAQADSAS